MQDNAQAVESVELAPKRQLSVIGLPMVWRELRVKSRQWQTYWRRTGLGLIGSVVAGGILWGANATSLAQQDQMGFFLFSTLIWMAAFFAMQTNTVDAISQEKREGTLGLLFLTDLKGYDVILGKLFANSLLSLYGMLACIPLLAICLLLGGVTPMHLVMAGLGLLNFVFFVNACCLFVSTFSYKLNRAQFASMFLMLLFGIGPIIVANILMARGIAGWNWLLVFSFAQPLLSITKTTLVSGQVPGFWESLSVMHALAWLFLIVASLRVPHCWQIRAKVPLRERVRQWFFGYYEARTFHRRELMDVNPFTWLAARSRFERVLAWLLTIVLAGFWFWIWYKIALDNNNSLISMCLITPPILSFIFCCLASIDSAREFEQQRLSGSLEFLLSCTPLTVPEVLRGQWLALKRKWFGPVMVVLASDLALTVALARHHDSMSEEDFPMAVMFILAVTALLPIQLICTAWVGMLQGIRSKKLGQSRISGFVLTMIFPTLAWATMLVLASLFNAYVFVIFHPGFWLLFGSWIVISVGLQLALATHARRCLLADFRIMANPLIDGTFRFWRWLGRTLAEQIYGKPARRSPTVFD